MCYGFVQMRVWKEMIWLKHGKAYFYSLLTHSHIQLLATICLIALFIYILAIYFHAMAAGMLLANYEGESESM